MRRETVFSLSALALLVATGIAVGMPNGAAETPLRGRLDALPVPVGWAETHEAPESVLRSDGRAPLRLARGYTRGQVFTRDGRLVASTAQEGLIRSRV